MKSRVSLSAAYIVASALFFDIVKCWHTPSMKGRPDQCSHVIRAGAPGATEHLLYVHPC
jgi:hypothetical protein